MNDGINPQAPATAVEPAPAQITPRTQEQIADRIREHLDADMFGWRIEVLILGLDFEHAREWLKPDATAESWEPYLNQGDVDQAARDYYAFALEKIEGHRGLSAERSMTKLTEFAWLLGRDDVVQAMNAADYAQYGAPVVRAFATGFGLEWPDAPELARMADGMPCVDGCEDGCGR